MMTLDIDQLLKDWMKLYLNLMILKSRDPEEMKVLDDFREPLMLFHERAAKFFDDMGASAE